MQFTVDTIFALHPDDLPSNDQLKYHWALVSDAKQICTISTEESHIILNVQKHLLNIKFGIAFKYHKFKHCWFAELIFR